MKKIKIDYSTYFIILLSLICGLYKSFLIISLILLIHELGHLFFIKIFKITIIDIKIYPFGIVSNMYKDINYPINKDILIYFGGMLFQIILYLIINYLFNHSYINYQTYILFKIYNYSIFIFNLLPMVPLDGYYILNSIINKIFPYKFSLFLSILVSIISIIYFYIIFPKSSLIVISYLIYKIIIECNNINNYFNKFCLERYLNQYTYIKTKVINNINNLYREKKHIFIEKGKINTEYNILNNRFNNIK